MLFLPYFSKGRFGENRDFFLILNCLILVINCILVQLVREAHRLSKFKWPAPNMSHVDGYKAVQ